MRLINVNLIQRECRCIHEADASIPAVSHGLVLLSRYMTSASNRVWVRSNTVACLETQAAFSVYQVMGKFNRRGIRTFFSDLHLKEKKANGKNIKFIFIAFFFSILMNRLFAYRRSFLQESPVARISFHNAVVQSSTGINAATALQHQQGMQRELITTPLVRRISH